MTVKKIKVTTKIVLCLSLSLLVSCATILNIELKKRIEESNVKIEDVQFYTSKRIVLRRILRKEEKVDETSGKVKFKKGKYIETLIIKKKTPGILINQDEKGMYISFEEGENKYLPFRLYKGDYLLDYKKVSTKYPIEYGGKTYDIIKGFRAYLTLKKESRFDVDKKRRYIKGREVK